MMRGGWPWSVVLRRHTGRRHSQPYGTPPHGISKSRTAAKIWDFGWPPIMTALPHVTATSVGERVDIPVVSPGHTFGAPYTLDTRIGSVRNPLVTENTRRYRAQPWVVFVR